jgi:DNA-binding transcriptional regulator YiaG
VNDNGWSVRGLRKRLGMSQERFAAEIGVTFSTVSRWENGHNVPSHLSWRAMLQLAYQHGLGEDALHGSGPANAG